MKLTKVNKLYTIISEAISKCENNDETYRLDAWRASFMITEREYEYISEILDCIGTLHGTKEYIYNRSMTILHIALGEVKHIVPEL